MNTNLQRLAEKAGLMVITKSGNYHPTALLAEESIKCYVEFARLIAEDCGKIADEYADEHLMVKPSESINRYLGV